MTNPTINSGIDNILFKSIHNSIPILSKPEPEMNKYAAWADGMNKLFVLQKWKNHMTKDPTTDDDFMELDL